MLPDERSRPGERAASTSDHLAGVSFDSRPELAIVADSALQTLVALLLSSPPIDQAQHLIGRIPDPVGDPVVGWWLTGVRLSVDALVIPNPATAAAAAIQAGFEPPPGLRGHVASAGWAMVSEAASVPLACGSDFLEIVRESHIRRSADRAVGQMAAAVWAGDLDQLALVVQREAGSILALLAADRTVAS
jgi:hypothetical protein